MLGSEQGEGNRERVIVRKVERDREWWREKAYIHRGREKERGRDQ